MSKLEEGAPNNGVASIIGKNMAEADFKTCGTGLERSAREFRVPLSGHPRRLVPSIYRVCFRIQILRCPGIVWSNLSRGGTPIPGTPFKILSI